MPARPLLATLALLAALPAAADTFEVTPAGAGAQRLQVPPAFLSASAAGDLADLRLRDAAGREVPYLLVAPPAATPRWAGVARIRPIPPAKKQSGAELDLGAVRTVTGLRVALDGPGFLKPVRLEGSGDGQRWTTLLAEEVLYRLPLDAGACGEGCAGRTLERRVLEFPAAQVRWLRLVLDDRRSPPLPAPRQAEVRLDGGAPLAAAPTVPLQLEARPGEPGHSRFALRLPGPHLPVQAVALDVRSPRLARRARVLEARLVMGRLTPVELGSGTLLRVERDGVTVADLRLPVDRPEESELELVVEDGDNGPLELAAARAELAPLPWIYFESPDGARLTATLGDPALRPPRYDLEAVRPELPRLHPATAIAGERRAEALAVERASVAAPDPTSLGGAPLDRAAFRWSRPIPAAPAGLAAVRLDAAVLARSGDLGDLRILGPEGRQVPYLLERRDEPLVIALPPPSSPGADPARRGRSLRTVELPEAGLGGGRLVLETRARVFSRQVEVYETVEHAGHRSERLLASSGWASADPARPAPALTLELPAVEGRTLRLVLDDGDNAPLQLDAARLLLPAYRLRFFHPGPALQLLGGAPGVSAPRYDLALLAPRLRGAAARELALGGGAAEDAGAGDAARGRLIFWIVLAAAVAALLAVVIRLVGRGAPPAPGSGSEHSG
ncbi:MAG: DUF3999 family protein [Anaeromyxobacter sp.]